MYKLQVFSVLIVILCCSNFGLTQDIAFPEEEPVREFVNKDKRQPIYIPGKCAQNELYYPGDQKNDWICDCAPGSIYYPPKDTCYSAYRQGPCLKGEYLILVTGKSVPECKNNPCKRDNFVKLNGLCHQIGKPGGPCRPVSEGGGTLGVNATTLEIECLTTLNNDLSIFNVPPKECPPGSRRSASGKCREVA